MANKRYYKELKQLAKRANQRMVEFEKRGMKTAAYTRAQAFLEMSGQKKASETGRRFSETGKATYNEMQIMRKHLNRFLNAQTSTVSGTKKFEDKVWEGALKNLELDKYGITREEYFEIWESLPQKKKDRLYGSGTIIKMVSTALRKDRESKPKDEQRMTTKEIVEAIQASKTTKDAYKAIGITFKDMKQTNNLGKL